MALDEKTSGMVTTNEQKVGIVGYTEELGNFSVRLLSHDGELSHMSHLTTHVSGLDKIKEITENYLRAVSIDCCRMLQTWCVKVKFKIILEFLGS